MSAMSLYSQPMSLRVNSSASERALFAANTYVPVNLNGGGINVYISTGYIFLKMPFLVRQCIAFCVFVAQWSLRGVAGRCASCASLPYTRERRCEVDEANGEKRVLNQKIKKIA